MSTQNKDFIDKEVKGEEVVEIKIIEDLEDLQKEEEEEVTGHKLDTKIRANDGEDNYFDEAYFEK